VVTVTAGQRHEQTQLRALLEHGSIKRLGPGRPRLRPARLGGDKGYSSRAVRYYLRSRGIGVVIPTRSNERRSPTFDRAAYRERNVVERCVNRFKQHRAIATRFDKLAASYLAGVTLIACLFWL
jgi:transposase